MTDAGNKNVNRQRAGFMSYMDRVLDGDIKNIMSLDGSQIDQSNIDYLKTMRETLYEKLAKVLEIDQLLADQTEDDEDYTTIINHSMDYEVKIKTKLTSIDSFIGKHTMVSPQASSVSQILQPSSPSYSHSSVKVKLPTLNIKKFSGEPSEYQAFIESFTEAIDKNNSIPDIQKMNYLLGFVTGEAESLLKGLRLSGENYKRALNLLHERFGNTQILTTVHMNRIIELEPVHNIGEVRELRKLYDSVETEIRNLESLNMKHSEYGPLLIPLLINKVPNELKLILSREKEFDLENLLKCFKTELEAREKVSLTSKDHPSSERNSTATSLYTGGGAKNFTKQCTFCNRSGHKEQNCFIIKNANERKRILQVEKRCFVCLKSGHNSNNCKTNIKCFFCKGRHHVSICFKQKDKGDYRNYRDQKDNRDNQTQRENKSERDTKTKTVRAPQEENAPVQESEDVSCVAADKKIEVNNTFSGCQVYLETATTTASSPYVSKDVRILFDLGSQRSYISPNASKQLKLSSNESINICIKTFGGHVESKTLDIFNVKIETNEGPEEMKFCCNEICHPIKNDYRYDISSLPEFRNLEVADKGLICEKFLPIDILIGADNYWKLVKNKIIRSSKGLVGKETKLGYIFSGPLNETICSTVTFSAHALKCETCDIDSTLQKFWQIEEAGIDETPKETVLLDFENQIKFEENRYEVRLPFIDQHEILKDNLYNSTRRMNSLLKKFKSNEQLLHDYDTIIKDQLKDGIIEVAPENTSEGETYYMPHRPVLRYDRLTTKIRMVFDASSSTSGPALNDCLHAGPSLTSSLFGTLLRFRAKQIGVIADLEKAFLQIRLNEKDRDYARFLWISDVNSIDFNNFYNNDLVTYRFRRVLFGVTSSPFLLNATLRHHVNTHENELFRTMVLNSLHVDDLSTSFDNMQEAFDFYKNCKSHFALASLNLRKLQSNCADLQTKVKSTYDGDLETIDDNCTKVLGIPWDKTNDSLIISLSEILRKVNFENPTKRNVIQFASSIFDPLGLINPLVVKFKLLFQKLCTRNLEWDECIPDDLLKIWQELITDLRECSEIRFNRAYYNSNEIENVTSHELHGFSDASQDAYGCCIYLKPTVTSGKSTPSIVASKSRVAPLKKKTMPQLELLGAQLLSRLLKQVSSELQGKIIIDTCYAWTDSTIVYCWLKNEKLYKQFVQSRLNEIRSNEDIKVWKLIDTTNNPSDDNSRGLLLSQLKNNEKWHHGPSFLSGPSSSWPDLKPGDKFTEKLTEKTVSFYSGNCQFTDLTIDEKVTCLTCDESINLIPIEKFHVVREYKGDMEREDCEGVFSFNTQIDEPTIQAIIDVKRFSSLQKLLRVTAMVIGFIRKLRNKVNKKKEEKKTSNTKIINNNNDQIDDMVQAKLWWLKDIQKDFVGKQHDQMKKSLNVFTDSNDILRCHGRIGNAPVPFDTKYPVLLPKRHPFTLLVVRDSHVSVGHNKTKETLNHLRGSYWIPQGRSLVRTVINRCQLCKIYEGQKCRYPEAPILPKERLERNFAFTNIGIDYAGPVHIRNTFGDDESTYKAWIALITCSTTRAVYLDIAQNYDSDALIQLLERFFNRYGAPSKVISDNGSNFTANATKDFAKSRYIRWSYNVETAAWQGGLFERLIQSVKRILKKSLRKETLTYNELLTLLKKIENILNNRPLTYVYDTEVGQPPLTPNHLIYGRKITSTNSDPDNTETNVLKCDKLKGVLDYFWNQWRDEYITSLRERTHSASKRGVDTTIKVGDVCLIEDTGPRNNWKMGRVEETIFGKDNQIRAAVVKTINGPLRRPINKLVIIESSKENVNDIDFNGIKFIRNAEQEIKNFE